MQAGAGLGTGRGTGHGARVAIVQDHHEMGLNRTKMFVSVNEKAKSAASAGQACSLHVAWMGHVAVSTAISISRPTAAAVAAVANEASS